MLHRTTRGARYIVKSHRSCSYYWQEQVWHVEIVEPSRTIHVILPCLAHYVCFHQVTKLLPVSWVSNCLQSKCPYCALSPSCSQCLHVLRNISLRRWWLTPDTSEGWDDLQPSNWLQVPLSVEPVWKSFCGSPALDKPSVPRPVSLQLALPLCQWEGPNEPVLLDGASKKYSGLCQGKERK